MWQARPCMNPFSHNGISYVKVLVKQISIDSNIGLNHAVIVINILQIGIKYSCQADICPRLKEIKPPTALPT